MLNLNVIASLSATGNAVNEDLFDHVADAAWVFDGASGIGPHLIKAAPSDPFWLVHEMNAALKSAWEINAPTSTILKSAMHAVIKKFEVSGAHGTEDPVDRPTACLLLARLWSNTLQLSTVGDCWFVLSHKHIITEFGHKLGDVAAPVHKERARLLATGVPIDKLRGELAPFERAFRARANKDGGYAIVDLTDRWIDRLIEKTIPVASGDRFMMMSDGFYRLIDTFNLYTPASLLDAASTRGLQSLLDELRACEAKDKEAILHPRSKAFDDATAALIEIGDT